MTDTLTTRLAQERAQLEQFSREAERMIDEVALTARKRVNDTLQDLLRRELREFLKQLERSIQQTLEGALSGGIAGSNQRRGQATALQGVADLLEALQKAQRNT